MLHAGVLMKLGHFSIIRVAFEILPQTTRELMPMAAVLCMFSIIYGGFVAYYAKDTKYVIGYSSSSHMGYVFLGMAALDYISFSGAVIYMFAHAMATACCSPWPVGYTIKRTPEISLPWVGWSNRMPFIASCFIIACMASVGMPGTVNFIAEVMIIVGSWQKYPFQVIVAVVGIVLTMAYLFRMMRGIFYGPTVESIAMRTMPYSFVDRLPLLMMIATSIFFGIFPGHFYNIIRSGVDPLIARITEVVPLKAEVLSRESSVLTGDRPGQHSSLSTQHSTHGGPMTFSLTLSGADLLLMLPEIILTLWLCGLLIVDFTFPKLPKEQLAYLSVCGLVIVLANLLWYDRTGVSGTLFHHMFVMDRMAIFFKVLVVGATILVILASKDYVSAFDFSKANIISWS